MNNVKKTIGWADYTINPVKGLCPMACPWCYARRMYKRFGWETEIRYEPAAMVDLGKMPDGSRVFWGSTIELFGEWVQRYVMEQIFEACEKMDNLTHLFLTKQPHNLARYSPFPDNCWIGVSVAANGDASLAYQGLSQVEAGGRFISFEPLHGQIGTDELRQLAKVTNWWIIGAQTPYSKKTAPRIEWVREIVDVADKAEIPVFLKGKLYQVFVDNQVSIRLPDWAKAELGGLRQEFPSKIASGKKEGSSRA